MSVQRKLGEFVIPPEEKVFDDLYGEATFVDDVTGSVLNKKEAVKGRQKEMVFLFKWGGVYKKVKREHYMKVISTKWLDINKGDETNMNYRARLVGI